jgi:predicted PurR-regulated permease PerM
MGIFFALFFLFFTLRDADRFPAWLSRTGGFDPAEVTEVVALSRESVRGYFRGTAITAVVTAPIFMVPLVLLGIPLAVPIFILYFFLSFIPFLGAWITGAFAVLIALGTGGPSAALIIGITFIISNGTIQSAVNSWALGSSLRLHPVAVLLATMIGGTVAGLLGMVIGAPVLAACVKSIAAIRALRAQNTS